MSQINNFEIAKNIIIALSGKLRTLKNEVPELLQFIEELDSIDFSCTHQFIETKRPSKEVLDVLDSVLLNLSNRQVQGLNISGMARLNWMNIYDGVNIKDLFIKGMSASRLLGLDGYYASNRISAGLMLILPKVIYPFHTHLVKEFYYCLSGKLLIQHDIDGKKFILDEGEISITPEGTLHSLEVVGKTPVLLLYSWLGNLNAPITIWNKMKSERWEGYSWTRLPRQKWKRSDLRQLSNKDFLDLFSKYS